MVSGGGDRQPRSSRRHGVQPGFLAPEQRDTLGAPIAPEDVNIPSFAAAGGSLPGPRARPELAFAYGEQPVAALSDDILSGHVKALVVVGANPARLAPDSAKFRAAVDQLDLVIAVDFRRTASIDLATHVLPLVTILERPDVSIAMDRAYPVPFAQYGRAAVDPPEGRRPNWRIFTDLARAAGVDLGDLPDTEEGLLRRVTGASLADLDELAAHPSGIVESDPPAPGWLIPGRIPRGRIDLAPDLLVEQLHAWAAELAERDGGLVLVGRRLNGQHNSLLAAAEFVRGRLPRAVLHPDDAAARGIADGQELSLSTPSGRTRAVAEVSDGVRPGVVSIPHGWDDPGANELTSDREGVDPSTGMPQLIHLQVEVEKVDAAR